MERLHLFEWEDFSWYPSGVREGQTDFLRFLIEFFKVYQPVLPLFAKNFEKSGEKRLIDFCSGGGGAIWAVWQYFRTLPEPVHCKAVLSDLYPNYGAFRHLNEQSEGEITFIEQAIDATKLGEMFPNLRGFCTFFNSFHHFKPEDAQKILQNLTEKRLPIGIFEPMEKSVWQIVANTLVLIVLPFLVMPFLRPFRLKKILFTYILPLIPFCLWWDGMVSVFRLYSPKEMLRLAESVDNQSYTWQAGKASHFFGKVTYLIGLPKLTTDLNHSTQSQGKNH